MPASDNHLVESACPAEAELFDFLRYNKKWWLLPILLMLGLFGVLMALAATGAV